jgi:hypothetical protein
LSWLFTHLSMIFIFDIYFSTWLSDVSFESDIIFCVIVGDNTALSQVPVEKFMSENIMFFVSYPFDTVAQI